MNDLTSDRAGVLIVRVWIEQGHPTALRARITQSDNNTNGERNVAVASSNEKICAIVQRWVATFTHPDLTAGDGPVKAADDDRPT